jgi:hypothetical protein
VFHGREREGASQREDREIGKGGVALGKDFRVLLGGSAASRRWPVATSRSRARRCFPSLNEVDKANLHITP